MSTNTSPHRRRIARFARIVSVVGSLALLTALALPIQANAATAIPAATAAVATPAIAPVNFQTYCTGRYKQPEVIWEGGSNANQNQQPSYSQTLGLCLFSGSYKALLQSDGNFVVYYGSHALWSSKTNGRLGKSGFIEYQNDGNLVLYYSNDYKTVGSTVKALWSTKSSGKVGPGRVLRMQSDGNLVLYACKHPGASTDSGLGITTALWSSGTSGKK